MVTSGLYSVKDAAIRLGLSQITVRRYVADKSLPSVQLGGKKSRIGIPIAAIESLCHDAPPPAPHVTNDADVPRQVEEPQIKRSTSRWRSVLNDN